MDSTRDLELFTVTVLSAVMFTVLSYLYLSLVGGVIDLTTAAIIGGLGGMFGYSATQILFSSKRKRSKK